MSRVLLLAVGGLAAGAVATGAPSLGSRTAGDARVEQVASATCARQSAASFPNAFGRSENLVVGPLAFSGLRSIRGATKEDIARFDGVKSPAIMRPGHTVLVSIDRRARRYVRINHGQYGRGGNRFRAMPHSIRFEACGRRRAQSVVDGSPATFWSGFFAMRRVPDCLPLTISVDGHPPRHRSLPVAGGSCGTPQVLVPRVLGLTTRRAWARLRQAGLRPSAYRGAIRYEPEGDGLGRKLELQRGLRPGPRRVTVQAGFPSRRRVPFGSEVAFGTQPAPGRWRFVTALAGGQPERLTSVAAGRGGRRLTLGITGGDCDPLDHVDVALRERWVLLMPFVIAGGSCSRRDRHQRAELRLPERLGGRPVLERPPDVPDPSLVNQHATPFAAARPSPDGRSVVVFYTYGGCDSLAGTRVAEGRRRVEITLLQGSARGAQGCDAIALSGLALVRLPSPLGGRRIVDASP